MNNRTTGRVEGARHTMVEFACPACDTTPAQQVVAADQVRCGNCAAGRAFQRGPLYVVTGCPGTGKSRTGRALAARLRPDLVVLDTDLTARPEHDTSVAAWLGFIETWLCTAVGVIQGGHTPELVGYSTPEQWAAQDLRHFLGPITFIALVCSDGELDHRLRERTWMGSPAERHSLAGLNRMFRAREDVTIIETDDLSPDSVADRILQLIPADN